MQGYEDFLSTKLLTDIPTGREVPLAVLPSALFDWQRALTQWALRRGRAALFADTGLGKTIMQLAWAQQVPGKVLILAPLGVAHQTIEEAWTKLSMPVHYVRRPGEMTARVCITNYDLLEHFCDLDVNGVVLDECFPAGTLVDTPHGQTPIENIDIGDRIYNANGTDIVVATKQREVSTLVCVELSNGEEIWCSENHPFFSQDGLIYGRYLKKGDLLYGSAPMRNMRRGHFLQAEKEQILQSILFSKMENAPARDLCKGTQRVCIPKVFTISAEILCRRLSAINSHERAYQKIKSNSAFRGTCKDLSSVTSNASQTVTARRQWQAYAIAADEVTRGAWRGMDSRVCHLSWEAHRGLSYVLQSRSGESFLNTCHRNRRIQSYGRGEKSARYEKGRETQFIRVERVTIHQQGSVGFCARSGGKDTVTCYDLQVAEHPSYSVGGVLVHNSSCLKGITSARRKLLFAHFTHIPFRLCCSATPAPNDVAEMAMHAQFLGVMKREDMLATFFVHDESHWRLMAHAREHFYRWLASWSMALRNPADLGYDGAAFVLPPLIMREHFLPWDDARLIANGDGQLGIPGTQKLHGIQDRIAVRKETIQLRVAHAVALAREAEGQVIIWCGLVEEGTQLKRLLADQDAYEVRGNDSAEWKQEKLLGFAQGDFRILITKGSIAGWGMNFQCAHTAIVCGMNDSQELFYQLVRREWRYGQTATVTTHVVLSEHERPIWDNVQQKEQEARRMVDGLIEAVKTYEQETLQAKATSIPALPVTEHQDDGWRLLHGDCVDGLRMLDTESVHLTVYSPPFGNLFQYNASERDLGNCLTEAQFFTHHGYVADELMRAMLPGRLIAMHMSQIPAMLVRDGWIGLKDFRGQMTAHMVERGWIYAGEVTCGKSPQAQAIRIRAKGLAFHQLHKDSAWSRPCLGDYIVLFRKPGENPIPVLPDIDNDLWILWASNIWYSTYYDKEVGYREGYTLNVAEGRDARDTKHICPLPLDLVERCIRLWSNRSEICLDPFSGLGTVGVKAIEHGRRYIGCELKDSYVQAQLKNLDRAMHTSTQQILL